MAGRKKHPSVASAVAGKRKSPRTLNLTCAPPAGPKTSGDEPLLSDDEPLPTDDELPFPEKEAAKKKKNNRKSYSDP